MLREVTSLSGGHTAGEAEREDGFSRALIITPWVCSGNVLVGGLRDGLPTRRFAETDPLGAVIWGYKLSSLAAH